MHSTSRHDCSKLFHPTLVDEHARSPAEDLDETGVVGDVIEHPRREARLPAGIGKDGVGHGQATPAMPMISGIST